ncbi:hypothetical protein C8R45DRAFT_88839 [Mycena sanguinolenta]|nr:hypothetical protein C8R45DRAFT_88839 [Mycena sanguinolenta]
MTFTGASIREAVLQQEKRTRNCSKAELERFIEESELKIKSFESQIRALIELRDSERACVLALKYIASPIHSLPVELLAEIFDLAIRDETHIRDAQGISQVCSDWRRVAHSTPRLWTRTLEVDLCRKTEDGVDGLKTWLARSAQLAVRISLRLRRSSDLNRSMLEEGLTVAPRCSSLRLHTTPTTPPWLIKQLAQCKLDRLEVLDLGTIIITANDADPTHLIFTTVPHLRKLRLINLGTLQITVPWAQLTELSLDCNSFEVFDAFGQCTSLIRAYINILGRARLPEVIQNNPVRFRQLHALSLRVRADLTQILDYLSAPVLQELQLTLYMSDWSDTHLTTFQLRAPNITSLELSSTSLASEQLQAAIRHAPSLTHLKLTQCENSFKDSFIRTLYHHGGVTPLAPSLHNLVVHNNLVYFTESVLASMIASRWWTDAEFAAYAVPPAVTRWTYVELEFGRPDLQYNMGPQFTSMVKHIPSKVLNYF